jgi:penicillin-binding protein 1B
VWVGFDTPKSLQRPAADVAIPVWAGIVRAMTQEQQPEAFAERADLEIGWIDPFSGGRARPDCPSPLRVPFVKGTAPTAACAVDHTADWQRIYEEQLRADSIARARADSVVGPLPSPDLP